MLSASFDPRFLEERGRKEGERRVHERAALLTRASSLDVEFFPLPDSWPTESRVVLLDESGYPFSLTNRAGEDTALVVSRLSHVVAPPSAPLRYGPRLDTILYPGPISRLIADLNTLSAMDFGGRLPYRHADVADFGEKVDARKILELVSKNNLWAHVRSLWSGGELEAGDIVLLDGTLNVVQTPEAATADEIDGDLHESGVILAALSKRFAPKCADIVALGRALHPGRPFIFTVPPEKLLGAHVGADENQMIFTLGPLGRTLGLTFGIALSTDPNDLEYHGLFVSYRHNGEHRLRVARNEVVKVHDGVALTPEFVSDVLVPLGARLAHFARGVVSPNYPLPAGAVHSHVVFTADDLEHMVMPLLAALLTGGESLHYLEHDERQPHDAVDALLNRFYGGRSR